ncbi:MULTISPECIES: VOC family protein [unclassified Roseovarius]|uniref:VOC family protein n=1 Tax=unclassified Roseovarius TaxID=2614913 RepID=UPI00125F4452|nr:MULTISPECIES: VOC family protein [unclassified Roseovarius]
MMSGLHHVTGITADVQANVDFYVGFLGLKLVKRTAGYADSEQLHLIYGDGLGSPGSLLTFLVWEATGRGRTGIGQVLEIALAVPPASIESWLSKALAAGVPFEGPSREFGEPVLRLRDPDGLIVKLVGVALSTPAPLPEGPIRLRGVTVLTDKARETAEFLTVFGYKYAQHTGLTQRMTSETDVVDVRDASGFVPSVAGAGVPDHVAFRAKDADDIRTLRQALLDHGPTEIHDRKYFLSLYVRDPAGILMEYATDGPGMTIDEAPEALGRTLFFPPHVAGHTQDIEAMLPQFSMPGDERFPVRKLPFVHRFNRPERPDGTTLVLLHGSGGNEADLMPIARRIAPQATLLGVRGRATEEQINRWFRRFDATTFDQADIQSEAAAFAAFVEDAVINYGIDVTRLFFLGYSNGANFLAAVMQVYPSAVRRAVLLRAVQVLDPLPVEDLSGTLVLMVNGQDSCAPVLADNLRAQGAQVGTRTVPSGHELTAADVAEVADWLGLGYAGQ